jgi:hypothetical protein
MLAPVMDVLAKADEEDSDPIERDLIRQVVESFAMSVRLRPAVWQQRLKFADTPF